MEIETGPEMFRSTSYLDWVNNAQSRFKAAGVGASQYVAICGMGKQFMSARDRGAFPVVVYHIEPTGGTR